MLIDCSDADFHSALLKAGLSAAHADALEKITDRHLRVLALIEMAYRRIPAEEAENYVRNLDYRG